VAKVNEIAQGRVWDGGTARQLGLVDAFGSLDDAIAEAARRAKLDADSATAIYLEREPTFFEQMFSTYGGADSEPVARDIFSQLAQRPQDLLLRAMNDAGQILSGPAIQARCLECPGSVPPPRAAPRASLSARLWEALIR
ncbi:MAG: S49 family peptidase, partial [Pseudomonadota bacterium]|nr:S49 family peptidase [Pseudomonadota bacterium]